MEISKKNLSLKESDFEVNKTLAKAICERKLRGKIKNINLGNKLLVRKGRPNGRILATVVLFLCVFGQT